MRHGLTPVMKAALQWVGVSAGDPYPPYSALSGADRQTLESYLSTTELTHYEAAYVER